MARPARDRTFQPSPRFAGAMRQRARVPGVEDPDFIRSVFGGLLPITEVLPIESDRFLTFEYIGLSDYLGERPNLPRTRGAMTTSVDAAVRYRTPEGTVEIALARVEVYRGLSRARVKGAQGGSSFRALRPLWDSSDCPVHHDLVPYEDLFVEPFYQLFRQQMLACQMERAREHDAERVSSCTCVRPPISVSMRAMNRASHRDAGNRCTRRLEPHVQAT